MAKFLRIELPFDARHFKDCLGLPFSTSLNDNIWWGLWVDHARIERVWMEGKCEDDKGDYVVLVSEPYQLSEDSLQHMLAVCRLYDLEFVISGGASHHPNCCRIELRRKEHGEARGWYGPPGS